MIFVLYRIKVHQSTAFDRLFLGEKYSADVVEYVYRCCTTKMLKTCKAGSHVTYCSRSNYFESLAILVSLTFELNQIYYCVLLEEEEPRGIHVRME